MKNVLIAIIVIVLLTGIFSIILFFLGVLFLVSNGDQKELQPINNMPVNIIFNFQDLGDPAIEDIIDYTTDFMVEQTRKNGSSISHFEAELFLKPLIPRSFSFSLIPDVGDAFVLVINPRMGTNTVKLLIKGISKAKPDLIEPFQFDEYSGYHFISDAYFVFLDGTVILSPEYYLIEDTLKAYKTKQDTENNAHVLVSVRDEATLEGNIIMTSGDSGVAHFESSYSIAQVTKKIDKIKKDLEKVHISLSCQNNLESSLVITDCQISGVKAFFENLPETLQIH